MDSYSWVCLSGCIFRFMLDPSEGPITGLSPGEVMLQGRLQKSTAFCPFIHIFIVNSRRIIYSNKLCGDSIDPKSHSCILLPWATLGCSGESVIHSPIHYPHPQPGYRKAETPLSLSFRSEGKEDWRCLHRRGGRKVFPKPLWHLWIFLIWLNHWPFSYVFTLVFSIVKREGSDLSCMHIAKNACTLLEVSWEKHVNTDRAGKKDHRRWRGGVAGRDHTGSQMSSLRRWKLRGGWSKELSHEDVSGKNSLGKGNHKGRSPGAGVSGTH